MENKKLIWLIIGVVVLVVIMACAIPAMTVKSVSSHTDIEYHVESLNKASYIDCTYVSDYTPASGNTYLIVKVTFKNVSNTTQYISMNDLNVKINGVCYTYDLYATGQHCRNIGATSSYTLGVNATKTLYGVYEVPASATQCQVVKAFSYLHYKEV